MMPNTKFIACRRQLLRSLR